MKPIIIIPARLQSTRLPNKPLAMIGHQTMIEHVYDRAVESKVGPVVVACCGEEIKAVIKRKGGEAIITPPDLPSGSDRVNAALKIIDPNEQYNCVINLQGDLPFVTPHYLQEILIPFTQKKGNFMSTLCAPFQNARDLMHNGHVQVILSYPQNGTSKALFFSRYPVSAPDYYHHIGMYAYSRETLERFVSLQPSPLEKLEKLEQMRALENDIPIYARVVGEIPFSVDTPEDLEKLINMMDYQ